MSRKNLIIVMVVAAAILIVMFIRASRAQASEKPKTLGNGPPPAPFEGPFDTNIFEHINLDANTSPFQGGNFEGSGAGASFA